MDELTGAIITQMFTDSANTHNRITENQEARIAALEKALRRLTNTIYQTCGGDYAPSTARLLYAADLAACNLPTSDGEEY